MVNVEPYKAIVDIKYFLKKIDNCIHNRNSELLKMQGKEMPIIPKDYLLNVNQEMNHLPADIYLEMTVLPLLQNALNMCDMIRPPDPISFIANFMLMKKDMAKSLEDIIKELPQKIDKKDKKIELLINEEEKDEKFDDEIEEEEKIKLAKSQPKIEEIPVEEVKKVKEEPKKAEDPPKKTKSKVTSKASVNSKK